MLKIKKSGAELSRIVQIGARLKQLSGESGQEYLPLNRGVNMVTPIDLRPVVAEVDFNGEAIQVYPPGAGFARLRQAIADRFFAGSTEADRILITAGGMNGLDLIFQTLDVQKILLPAHHWGSYNHILTIRGVAGDTYGSHAELENRLLELAGCAVLICDPGNPLGEKYDDREQFRLLRRLNDAGVAVIFDSPYRRLFTDEADDYYAQLTQLPGVVICESFSKSLGLSGQRIGFIHSMDEALNRELAIRLMYCTNGVNGFAQELVYRLLTTEVGREEVLRFQERTRREIAQNIAFLRERGLLAEEFYTESEPEGLFAVVRCTEQELLAHRIGSVSLAFFTRTDKERAGRYARICVSFPHAKFAEYFLPVKPTI
ncbi:MAG: pyridoxal phosphate-dependent aminotransferase [Rikenellaceae bacterium]|jgi:aspartate/methionine/tyrosine aminotransferase|nr:pyridoxal phosphate-dependent aminotransferase [Rikenellaceae bacterium]